ncbi:hypothetical protein B0J13DRAFT_571377 [Dactylonectria estremocensis]|uniref:C2H2-type domain-containing protein n=1 Tax=Dactylonectria estremocensis TaxID=1079267 RepID=A0A9P9ICM0_9HYPO|nr:hypothetical protein B0J13DRAFT_571377 [Dactylonectria estremocensis]
MANPFSYNPAVSNAPSTANNYGEQSCRHRHYPSCSSARHCILTITASTITANAKAPANFPPSKTTGKPHPHVCGTCQHSFTRSQNLKRHERSHTKEKPFKCPKCARCFHRRDILLRHLQTMHQTSTLLSHPGDHSDSTSDFAPVQSRALEDSVTGSYPAVSNAPVTSITPQANTLTHVDGSMMQMIAPANASVAQDIPPTQTHTQHPSLAGLPIDSLDHAFGGMSAAIGQRGVQHGLPKLETHTLGSLNFHHGLQTAPPIATFNAEFDFDGPFFRSGLMINPDAFHYNNSPQSIVLEQALPFTPSWNEMPSSQTLDYSSEWPTGFEHPISFHTNENEPGGLYNGAHTVSKMSRVMVENQRDLV